MSEAPSTQSSTVNQPDPAVEAAVTAQLQNQVFGMSDGKENRSASEPTKDNPSKEPTSSGGPEGSTQSTKRLFAGKYETPEALETGYSNLFSEGAKMKSERDMLARRNAILEEQLKSGAAHTAGATPAGSSSAEDFWKQPQVQTLLQKAEEIGGKELVDLHRSLLQLQIESKSSVSTTTDKGSKAGEESPEASKALELAQQHFSEQYPELATGESAEKFAKFMDAIAQNPDPYAQLELCRAAFMHGTEAERLDKAVTDAAAKARKEAIEERDKHWKSVMVSGGLVIGTTGPGEGGDSALKQEQNAHFGVSD